MKYELHFRKKIEFIDIYVTLRTSWSLAILTYEIINGSSMYPTVCPKILLWLYIICYAVQTLIAFLSSHEIRIMQKCRTQSERKGVDCKECRSEFCPALWSSPSYIFTDLLRSFICLILSQFNRDLVGCWPVLACQPPFCRDVLYSSFSPRRTGDQCRVRECFVRKVVLLSTWNLSNL